MSEPITLLANVVDVKLKIRKFITKVNFKEVEQTPTADAVNNFFIGYIFIRWDTDIFGYKNILHYDQMQINLDLTI